jgi:hypothetical protein
MTADTITCRALTRGLVVISGQPRQVAAGETFELPTVNSPTWWAIPVGGDETPLDAAAQHKRDVLLARLDARDARIARRAQVARTPTELARRFATGTGLLQQQRLED